MKFAPTTFNNYHSQYHYDGRERLTADAVPFLNYSYGTLSSNGKDSSYKYRYGFQGQEKDDEIKGEGNSVNYKYRMHDTRIGRFFAVDPLTKNYAHYSPYSFSGNEVIAAVEIEGLEPDRLFQTKDQAAINWGKTYNGKSIVKQREYSSLIYSVEVEGKSFYAYNKAVKGSEGESSYSTKVPTGATIVADIHSHGHFDEELLNTDPDNDKSLGPEFTSLDPGQDLNNGYSRVDFVNTLYDSKIDSYLTTSNGSLLLLEVEKNKKGTDGWDDRVVDIICECLPSDSEDPSRKNDIPASAQIPKKSKKRKKSKVVKF